MKTATYASLGALLAISLTVVSAHSYLQPDADTIQSQTPGTQTMLLGSSPEPAIKPALTTPARLAAKPDTPLATMEPGAPSATLLAALPRAKIPLYTGAVKKKAQQKKRVVQKRMPKAQSAQPGVKYVAVNRKRSGPKKRITLRKDIWTSGVYR